MSNNNGFLSNYNKDSGDFGEPVSEVVVRDADLGYKYEEKSGFKKPEFRGGSGLPPFRRPKLFVPIIAGAAAVVGVVLLLVLLLNGGVAVIDFTGKPLSDAQLWANGNGVMLSTNEQFNDEYDKGVIITQDKKKGETIKKGEFLSLTVSKGHDFSVTLKVPDIMNMTNDQIQVWADQNFMEKVRITTEFSDTVPSGKVIRFTINDNTVISDEIRRDTPVYVIISKGPQDQSSIQVTVPDFKTMSVSEAQLFANDNGITLDIAEQYDAYVPKGSVISQSVKAQEKVSKGSVIKLVYSLGKMVEIPDFSVYTKEQASAVATGLGIPVTITEKYSGSSAGRFLKQSLAAGSVYGDNDFLVLTYSLGNQVAITSYVGQTKDTLLNWASELNTKGAKIKVDGSTEIYDSSPKGTILSQNPVNELISYSSTIYITVSLGSQKSVPSLVDNTPIDIKDYDNAITREKAVERCTDAGLIPKFVTASTFNPNFLPGEVIDQNPSAGTETPEWSIITLKLNPFRQGDIDKVKVEPFIGMAQTAIDGEPENKYHKNFTIIYKGEGATVIAQSIAKDTIVNRGSVIILTRG